MSVVAAIRRLMAEGFSVDQALAAAEAFEQSSAPIRTARQERNARYYAKKASEKRLKPSEASEASNSDEIVLNQTTPRVRGEDNLQTTEIAGKKKEEGSPSARSTRGTRLPADYAPDLSVATCERLSVEDAAREASKFRDYFAAAPGQKGVKLDWDATWRNWCRRASEDRQRQRGPPSSVKPGSAVAALGRFLERQDDGRQGREGEADHAAAQRLSADDRQLRPAAGGFRPALNTFPD